MGADAIKQALDGVIDAVCGDPSRWVARPGVDFTRDRKLPLRDMIRLVLAMDGGSIGRELYDYDPANVVTTSAFVQQRDKMLPSMFEHIFNGFNRETAGCDGREHRGMRIIAADGSDLTFATDESAETYIRCNDRAGVNQFHLNALYDVLNKTYVDALVQPRPKLDERKAAIEMVERNSWRRALIVADRGYESYNFFEHLRRTPGVDYLVRVKNGQMKPVRSLPMTTLDVDRKVEVRTTQTKADKEDYAAGRAVYISGKSRFGKAKKCTTWDFEPKCEMNLRIVRFPIAEGVYETVVTSLPRERFGIEDIKELYNMRWGIETSFRELKYAVGLVNFHAKKESAVLQEIFARLTIYNMSQRIIMSVVVEQDGGRKWTYQADFTFGIHACKRYFRHHGGAPPPDVEAQIAARILPVRKGRADRRKPAKKMRAATWFSYRVA